MPAGAADAGGEDRVLRRGLRVEGDGEAVVVDLGGRDLMPARNAGKDVGGAPLQVRIQGVGIASTRSGAVFQSVADISLQLTPRAPENAEANDGERE